MLGLGTLGEFPLGGGPSNLVNVPTVSWFSPLSEPVKFRVDKRRAVAINNQTFSFDPIPVVSFSYFTSLSEPRRFRVGLAVRDQPFFSFQPTPIIDISWFNGLSEPVRQKRRLRESLQSFEPSKNILPIVSFGWFEELSGPVRLKKRLREADQSVLTRGEFIPASFNAQLMVTEKRDFMVAVLYQFNIPISAYVDIIENDPSHLGNVGVVENMSQAAIVSINEPQTIPATGTPVSVAGARVAVIVQ